MPGRQVKNLAKKVFVSSACKKRNLGKIDLSKKEWHFCLDKKFLFITVLKKFTKLLKNK